MKVEDLMSHVVSTCPEADSLENAACMMGEFDVGCLVVTNAERVPIGIVTDRDCLMYGCQRGVSLRDASVRDAMNRQVYTCHPSASLDELERLMQLHAIRRVPVVDEKGRLVGIITLGDLAQYSQWSIGHFLSAQRLARTLSAITRPRLGGRHIAA